MKEGEEEEISRSSDSRSTGDLHDQWPPLSDEVSFHEEEPQPPVHTSLVPSTLHVLEHKPRSQPRKQNLIDQLPPSHLPNVNTRRTFNIHENAYCLLEKY